ncbi:hypothetical protein L484_004543 [Morus notabilis]|uniref:Uncharacterized protein n=1 Tax=Morus notabilis TaxID=981085 RepID=W9RUS0_9ROSA|nr:hypothetical protein L484_004543 [Morus notabilis]
MANLHCAGQVAGQIRLNPKKADLAESSRFSDSPFGGSQFSATGDLVREELISSGSLSQQPNNFKKIEEEE